MADVMDLINSDADQRKRCQLAQELSRKPSFSLYEPLATIRSNNSPPAKKSRRLIALIAKLVHTSQQLQHHVNLLAGLEHFVQMHTVDMRNFVHDLDFVMDNC